MDDMTKPDVTPFVRFEEVYDTMFHRAILNIFNEQIQKQYTVTGYAQMPDGKVVIRLERAVMPKDRP